MMGTQFGIRSLMQGHTLVPVVTFREGDDPLAFMHFLLAQNVHCIEITLRTPFGIEAIRQLKAANMPNVLVGAGTVTRPGEVNQLQAAGADFLVSPGLTETLFHALIDAGLPFLPGVGTPSEVMAARERGLDTLKFFPANLLGGLGMLKAYSGLFPDVQFCPTGGINRQTAGDYLALSNVFAVGGSWFQKEYEQAHEP